MDGREQWRAAFERVWADAIAAEEAAAHAHPLERHWPPAQRWPGYAMRKVRTRRLAEQLASAHGRNNRGKQEVELEQEGQAFGGMLRGRPDVVRSDERGGVIEDYKTGSLYEAGTEEVKAAYRMQLLLYAVLERNRSGLWPRSARLIPLEGEPETLEIDPAEAEALANEVVSALKAYNEHVAEGTPPEELASAAPDHCRFCAFSVRCPAFWATVDRGWAEEGILAAAGEVEGSEASRFDTFDLELDASSGSVEHGRLRLQALDVESFGPALDALQGHSFAATGLRPGAAPGLVRSTARTRLVTE